eukprot:m.964675 g.964675  ORF g.964675 m.964675 type:complete len:881 (+) comp23904_c0_seq7:236-2878(+)
MSEDGMGNDLKSDCTTTVLKAGFCVKEGHTFKTWRRRWCILRTILPEELGKTGIENVTHVLAYYRSEQDALKGDKPCGAVLIAKGLTIARETKKATRKCIRIETPGLMKVYFIQPTEDFDGWERTLTGLEPPADPDKLRHDTLPKGVGIMHDIDEPETPVLIDGDGTGYDYADSGPQLVMGVAVSVLQRLLREVRDVFADKCDSATTKDVVDRIMKPHTFEAQSSYLELMQRENAECVGTANAFVSHAWKCSATKLLEALIEFSKEQERRGEATVYFWIDMCSNNQHEIDQCGGESGVGWEWFQSSFTTLMRACGRLVVVATPYSAPEVCQRAWCLFEAAVGAREKLPLEVCIPPVEEMALKQAITADAEVLVKAMMEIDSRHARATVAEDLKNIQRLIETEIEGSYGAVDDIFKGVLRQWITEKGQQILLDAEDGSMETAHFARQLGRILERMGQHDQAIAFYNEALDVDTKLLGAEHPETALSLMRLTIAYRGAGEYVKALECGQQALEILRKAYGTEHIDIADAHNAIGLVHYRLGNHTAALQSLRESLRMNTQLRPDHAAIADDFSSLGLVYKLKGDSKLAVDYYKRAIALQRRVLGPEHPDLASSYNNLGVVYERIGDYDEAISLLKKSHDIKAKIHGMEHPSIATSYNNIAIAYNYKGDYDRGIEYHTKALEIKQKVYDPDHHSIATTTANLGLTYNFKGEHEKAIELCLEALRIHLKVVGPDHCDTAGSYSNLGNAYDGKGDWDTAVDYFEKSLAIKTTSLGPQHPDVALLNTHLARTYVHKGDYDKAIALCEAALAVRMDAFGADNVNTAATQSMLGIAYKGKGDRERAIEFCDQALAIQLRALGSTHPATEATNAARQSLLLQHSTESQYS